MRALIEKTTRTGRKSYETVERIEKIVLLCDVKPVLQINKDFTMGLPERGMASRDSEKG